MRFYQWNGRYWSAIQSEMVCIKWIRIQWLSRMTQNGFSGICRDGNSLESDNNIKCVSGNWHNGKIEMRQFRNFWNFFPIPRPQINPFLSKKQEISCISGNSKLFAYLIEFLKITNLFCVKKSCQNRCFIVHLTW